VNRNLVLFVAFVGWATAAIADDENNTSHPRYVQCKAKDANCELDVAVLLPGNTREHLTKFYFELVTLSNEGHFFRSTTLESACGPAESSVYSVEVLPRNSDVLVTISRDSNTNERKGPHATSSISVRVPVDNDVNKSGTVGGIGYKVIWRPISSVPNQSTDPTP
jgi:hypothetical protein